MIKRWLKRSPRLYFVLQRSYYAGLYFTERYVLGTKLHKLLWQVHNFEESAKRSQDHPRRAFLVERIGRFAPFGSILEVGCNGGLNLVKLGRAYPGVRLHGVDISARAIKLAESILAQEAIGNATVYVGMADDLRQFADNSVDVALTDSTLMYVGPDKIMRAISELARVARKGLILNEWHLFERQNNEPCAYWYYAHWVHDYRALLGGVPGVKAVRIERLPHGLWGPGGWETFGALVDAEL